MAEGRLDVLIVRLAEEFGARIQAKTTIDIRDALKETAERLVEDMGVPRTPITANSIVRSILDLPDRAATPGPRQTKKARLRRVV